MPTLKRIALALATNAFFWVVVFLGLLAGFIYLYENPVSFEVNQQYHLY